MSNAKRDRRMTRRTVMRHMGAATAGVVGVCRTGLGKQASSAGGAVRVERAANGSEVWQVTTEELSQSNIYCEVPYCSGDSRYFVYARTNPKLSGNRTEFMAVELGTWKQHRLDTAASASGTLTRPLGSAVPDLGHTLLFASKPCRIVVALRMQLGHRTNNEASSPN